MKKLLLFLLTVGSFAAVNAQTPCDIQFTATSSPLPNHPYRFVFQNNSINPTTPTWYAVTKLYYGDGPSYGSFYSALDHNYPGPGTYTAYVIRTIYDSLNTGNPVMCTDSEAVQVIVPSNPANGNHISGHLYWNPANVDSISHFKVWLITHDATANTLTAVDSVEVMPWATEYVFHNPPAGSYLVKAKPYIPVVTVPYGAVPTYHDSSVYWNGAAGIAHNGAGTDNMNIWLQNGTPTSGPGFVGGNISSGAGKGTGTGVAGMLVFLRNSTNNKMVASGYTDANGNYTFSNIGMGTYNVYPEDMNYATTPSAPLSITTGQTSNNGIDFVQTEDEIMPKSTLGISPVSSQDALAIYPNPVSDVLIVDNKNGGFNQLTVVNTLGQVVKQAGVKKGTNKIGMETLHSGIYYVIVRGTDGARSIKITKK